MKIKVHDDVDRYGGFEFDAKKVNGIFKTTNGKFFGFHEADILNENEMRETADASKVITGSEQRRRLQEKCKSCDRGYDSPSGCPMVCDGDTVGYVPKHSILGAGINDEIVTNKQGGKQSKIATAFSLVPHESLLTVARVMKIGSERYEKDNWRRLSADEIYDHLMEHLVNWNISGDMEELSHAVTRAMMLYEVANNGK